MARTLAGRMAEALFAGYPNRKKRVAIYTAYSDESGSSDDGKSLFLMGGYIASAEYWPHTVDAWKERVLDSPPAIPNLHMSEVGREKFRAKYGITSTQARQKVDTAIDILTSSGGLLGFFSVMKVPLLDDFRDDLRADGLKPNFGVKEPDYLCYLAYAFHLLAYVYVEFIDVEKVDFVVAIKQKVTNHILKFHESLRATVAVLRPELLPFVGRVIPEFAKDSPGLQMADLLCWNLRKTYETGVMERDLCRLQTRGARRICCHEHTAEDLAALKTGIMKRLEQDRAKIRNG